MAGRYVGPLHTIFRGPPELQADLQGRARSLVGQLSALVALSDSKKGMRGAFHQYADGAHIKAVYNNVGAQPIAVAYIVAPQEDVSPVGVGLTFLESGMVVFNDWLPCVENEFGVVGTAGQLVFNDRINTIVTERQDIGAFTLIGELNTIEQEGEDRYEAYPPLPQFQGSEDYPAGDSRAFSCTAWSRKELANSVPPSVFPQRLMRLLVQSKYGNPTVTLTPVGSIYAIIIENKRVSNSSSQSDWLYVHEDEERFEYWVITATAAAVTANKLILPQWAQDMVAYIRRFSITGEDQLELEKWILGHSSWGAAEDAMIVMESPPSISPLAYGWQVTSDGKMAKCVSATGDIVTGYTYSTATLEVNLEYNQFGNAIWSGVGSTATHATGVRHSNRAILWKMLSDASCVPFEGGAPVSTFSNVPVYGWYNDSDSWQTETLSADSAAGTQPIDINSRDICSLTWSGTAFRGNRVFTSTSSFRSAPIPAGDFTYTSLPGYTVSGVLSATGKETMEQSDWNSTGMPTDNCDNKPLEPDCSESPYNGQRRFKRQEHRESLTRKPYIMGGGAYSSLSMAVPARGDCRHMYVGAWVYSSFSSVTVSHYRRRTHWTIEPYECYNTDLGEWVGQGWSWEAASSSLSGWTIMGSAVSDAPHSSSEMDIQLVGASANKGVFSGSGTGGTAEAGFGTSSALVPGGEVDFGNKFSPGGWGPYFEVPPIGFSTLHVRESAVEQSLGYVDRPGGIITYQGGSWTPEHNRHVFVGGA